MKRTTVLLVMVIAATLLIPVSAYAAPLDGPTDASVIGKGTWATGSSSLSCQRTDRIQRDQSVDTTHQCSYNADSAPSQDRPEEGCTEISVPRNVTGCRAVLSGLTSAETFPFLEDVCLQGGAINGNPEYPAGRPDGRVAIYSGALNQTYTVPVTITVNGAFGRVFGLRQIDSEDVTHIVVEGKFLWNTKGQQGCPGTGDTGATGVWQGHFTFFNTTR